MLTFFYHRAQLLHMKFKVRNCLWILILTFFLNRIFDFFMVVGCREGSAIEIECFCKIILFNDIRVENLPITYNNTFKKVVSWTIKFF